MDGSLHGWRTLQVRRRWQEARDIVAIELGPLADERLPAFEAGAFIDVEWPGGLIRPYSLANAPSERHRYLLAILVGAKGSASSLAVASLRVGDRLRASEPRNAFALQGGSIHSVLLAGGIGVTPILSMAEQLWRVGSSFDLHYGFRTPDGAAFLSRLRQSPYARRVHLWCSGDPGSGRLDVHQALKRVPKLSHIYVCGPERLMRSACEIAEGLGWHSERIHRESFAAGGDARPAWGSHAGRSSTTRAPAPPSAGRA